MLVALLLIVGMTMSYAQGTNIWWDSLGAGLSGNQIRAVIAYGGEIVAGGDFVTTTHSDTMNYIAAWNGTQWHSVGGGMNGKIYGLEVMGSDLYAVGRFTAAGGVPARYVAKWNGTKWDSVGPGFDQAAFALKAIGSNLYAGGDFLKAGNTWVYRVARWNGSAWTAMNLGLNGAVADMATDGTNLYVTGSFTTASGIAANRIARWNGTQWDTLGSGFNGTARGITFLGTDLYVGGLFTKAGGVNVNRVAKWNGTGWSALGQGMFNEVRDLITVGGHVYAGGAFITAGGVTSNHMSMWTGYKWIPLGSGTNDTAYVLGTDGQGTVVAAGSFDSAGGKPARLIARWVAPIFSMDTSTIHFGSPSIGYSAIESVMVHNLGPGTLQIDSIVSADTAFTTSPETASIPGRDSMKIYVIFTPPDTGQRSTDLVFFHNGVPSTDTVSAEGGTQAVAVFSTKVVDFGVSVDLDPQYDSVWIRNDGTFPLSVGPIVSSSGVFTVDPDTAGIAPGDSTAFTITFTPPDTGYYEGLLIFSHNGVSQKDTVEVSGGTVAGITFSVASLDFGTLVGIPSAEDSITVYNSRPDTLHIGSVSATNARFSVDPASAAIAPGDSLTFSVVFTPQEQGEQSGYLVFAHDATPPTDSIAVTGDAVSALRIGDVSVAEGDSGVGTAMAVITLSLPGSETVSVTLQTSDGTATAGYDYVWDSTRVVFLAGEDTALVPVYILGDRYPEPDETVLVSLSAPQEAVLADSQGVVTILNDDDGLSGLSIADVSVAEGDLGITTAHVVVTLSAPSDLDVSVEYATANGTAVSGSDYVAVSGTILFHAGSTADTVEIPVLGESFSETDESLSVVLSGPVNAVFVDSVGVVTILNDDGAPAPGSILDVTDIPDDQGGVVRLRWLRSDHDSTGINPQVVSYGVWRKIPSSGLSSLKPMSSTVVLNAAGGRMNLTLDDTLATLYDYLGSLPAVQSPSYNMPVATLEDSTSDGPHYQTYLVTAHTSEPSVFFISAADSGYSVDNLSPIAPSGLVASIVGGSTVRLGWDAPTDPDVMYYTVFRSASGGFDPEPELEIGTSDSLAFTDADPVPGNGYYRVVAHDVHGNRSQPSEEVLAALGVERPYQYRSNWNLVSVPLTLNDYSKPEVFPTAATSAYAYQDGYAVAETLKNGVAYWLKFSSDQTVELNGLERVEDTVDVAQGWNLVGSLSSSLAVSNVGSVPGGIVTSSFYRYTGSYSASDTIEPGMGYWVKVTEAGKLVLSVGSVPAPATRIRVRPGQDVPPPPPDGLSGGGAAPDRYRLEQNYPNPFNPVTRIVYALPERSRVRLQVYNVLGQVVATLVDGVREAGVMSAEWDASAVPSGVYVCRITAGEFTRSVKMLLVR